MRDLELVLEDGEQGIVRKYLVIDSHCAASIELRTPYLGDNSVALLVSGGEVGDLILVESKWETQTESPELRTEKVFMLFEVKESGLVRIGNPCDRNKVSFKIYGKEEYSPFTMCEETGWLFGSFDNGGYNLSPGMHGYLNLPTGHQTWREHFEECADLIDNAGLWPANLDDSPANPSDGTGMLPWMNAVLDAIQKSACVQKSIDGALEFLGREVGDSDENGTSNLAKLCPRSNPAMVSGPANGAVDNINQAVDLLRPHTSEKVDWPHRLIGRHKGKS